MTEQEARDIELLRDMTPNGISGDDTYGYIWTTEAQAIATRYAELCAIADAAEDAAMSLMVNHHTYNDDCNCVHCTRFKAFIAALQKRGAP